MKKFNVCGKGCGIPSSISSQEKSNFVNAIFFSGSISLILNELANDFENNKMLKKMKNIIKILKKILMFANFSLKIIYSFNNNE